MQLQACLQQILQLILPNEGYQDGLIHLIDVNDEDLGLGYADGIDNNASVSDPDLLEYARLFLRAHRNLFGARTAALFCARSAAFCDEIWMWATRRCCRRSAHAPGAAASRGAAAWAPTRA